MIKLFLQIHHTQTRLIILAVLAWTCYLKDNKFLMSLKVAFLEFTSKKQTKKKQLIIVDQTWDIYLKYFVTVME